MIGNDLKSSAVAAIHLRLRSPPPLTAAKLKEALRLPLDRQEQRKVLVECQTIPISVKSGLNREIGELTSPDPSLVRRGKVPPLTKGRLGGVKLRKARETFVRVNPLENKSLLKGLRVEQ